MKEIKVFDRLKKRDMESNEREKQKQKDRKKKTTERQSKETYRNYVTEKDTEKDKER